jgi:hypothetical protein
MTTDAEIITFRYLPVLLVRERDVARRVGAPLCLPTRQAGHMAKRRVGVEYSPSMLEPVRPGAVSPDRALCLPTFSHFVIVNKTSLSLSRPDLKNKSSQKMISWAFRQSETIHLQLMTS